MHWFMQRLSPSSVSYQIPGLLLHMPNSYITEDNVISNTPDLQPHFAQVGFTFEGNPEVAPNPVGNGICFTDGDRVSYQFLASEPWQCPFDINECPTGFTLSFWFRWEYIRSNSFRNYITLGKAFKVYRAPNVGGSFISLRWNVEDGFSWYSVANLVPGEWTLVMWMVNQTHSVEYLNGLKHKTRPNEAVANPSDITNELYINRDLNAGNFCVGQMLLWSGKKSPVFMWRLYQEGLPDHGNN